MAASNRTSLSAGIVIRDALLNDPAVTAITKRIFPVALDKVALPYVFYRRSAIEVNPVKQGMAADTVEIEMVCCSKTYDQSLDLAEAVRAALCGCQHTAHDMTMRSCTLSGSEEGWRDDAFIQILNFNVKIS